MSNNEEYLSNKEILKELYKQSTELNLDIAKLYLLATMHKDRHIPEKHNELMEIIESLEVKSKQLKDRIHDQEAIVNRLNNQ